MKRAFVLTLAVSVILSCSAHAGVILKSAANIHGTQQITAKTTLYLARDRMRMESEDSMGGKQVVIFRKDKRLFWVIDPVKGTYTEITKAQLEQMKKQMEEYKRQMEAAMKNMPPEQKAMMKKMMKEQMPSSAPKDLPISYRKVGSGKIGKWYCTKFQGVLNGAKVEDVWVAPFNKLGISLSDLEILNQMGSFFDELYQGSGNSIVGDTKKWEDTFKGFPVKTVSYDNGRVVYEDSLKEVKKTSLPQTLFELPGGLKKEALIPTGR